MLGINQPPVTIKNVEVSIIDEAFERGYVTPQVPQRLTGFTVAVVGSGPAGLAAAQQLTRAGHTVAVYERDDAVGGLLRYGIPDFKLEKHHIDRRVAQMEAEGTRFRPGVEIGVVITWDALRARYAAVVVAPRLFGLDLLGRVLGHVVTRWNGALPPPTPAFRREVAAFVARVDAVPGLAVTGGWIAGTGLASIVGHAQECVRGLAPAG